MKGAGHKTMYVRTCICIMDVYAYRFIHAGTIHYLSDGLETLHYYTRENSTIIVTAGNV